MIVPNKTLLFQGIYNPALNQYCGIVTSLQNEYFVNVRWYKYGYKGPDFMDVPERIEDVKRWSTGPTHPFFVRHGLPPAYEQPVNYDMPAIRHRIKEILAQNSIEEPVDGVEELVRCLNDYVESLLKGHRR